MPPHKTDAERNELVIENAHEEIYRAIGRLHQLGLSLDEIVGTLHDVYSAFVDVELTPESAPIRYKPVDNPHQLSVVWRRPMHHQV